MDWTLGGIAGAEQERRATMVPLLGAHRPDQGEVLHLSCELRQVLADRDARHARLDRAIGPPLACPGLGSKVSSWLGPPLIQSRMHDRRGAGLPTASAAMASIQPELEYAARPAANSRRHSRRSSVDLVARRKSSRGDSRGTWAVSPASGPGTLKRSLIATPDDRFRIASLGRTRTSSRPLNDSGGIPDYSAGPRTRRRGPFASPVGPPRSR